MTQIDDHTTCHEAIAIMQPTVFAQAESSTAMQPMLNPDDVREHVDTEDLASLSLRPPEAPWVRSGAAVERIHGIPGSAPTSPHMLRRQIADQVTTSTSRGWLEKEDVLMVESKKSVYLAGPMTGCTASDKSDWRDQTKHRYRDHFNFVDPVESGVDETESTYERVAQDRKDIERCDAILANLWKMSSGTVVGIILAKNKGKTVVLVDEHGLASPILHFYCDIVVRDVASGIKELVALLADGPDPVCVSKRNGVVSEFRRSKLIMSIRKACQSAGVDDVTYPVYMFTDILNEVRSIPRSRGCVSTDSIAAAVLRAMDRKVISQAHAEYASKVAKVRDAWRNWVLGNRPARFASTMTEQLVTDALIRDEPMRVRVASEKSHNTVWDASIKSIDDLPSDARKVFQEILKVRGIAHVALTAFRAKGLRVAPNKPKVNLGLSSNPSIISGSLHIRGTIGRQQNFDIHLHDASERPAILVALRSVLSPKYINSTSKSHP